MTTHTSKHALMDLRLYLETPWPDPAGPLHKPGRNEMLLFFKHYDPEAEALRYVGHLFAPKAARMRDLFPNLRRMAGLPADAPLQCYEEIKWEPSVMVEAISGGALLFTNAQLETGDIIAFQVEGGAGASARFPTVKDFLSYVRNRMLVGWVGWGVWGRRSGGRRQCAGVRWRPARRRAQPVGGAHTPAANARGPPIPYPHPTHPPTHPIPRSSSSASRPRARRASRSSCCGTTTTTPSRPRSRRTWACQTPTCCG
jgi:hypothetical protein